MNSSTGIIELFFIIASSYASYLYSLGLKLTQPNRTGLAIYQYD